jgi:protoporphyrinogen oxidase
MAQANSGATVDVAIIGAGPAGLTAGYLLSKQGVNVLVAEKDPQYVGGISRTVVHEGYRFDIGGHRFFSKSSEVVDLWNELLPDDFIVRPRMSRIYYGGKYYSYPLRAFEALFNLGISAARCACSLTPAGAPSRTRSVKPSMTMGVQTSSASELFSNLLQDLHRKGVGYALRRNLRRLGGAAHQGPRPHGRPWRSHCAIRSSRPECKDGKNANDGMR